MPTVIVNSLNKSYTSQKETVVALSNISLEVEEGELFGLIGPDGAGKTTLFRILTTVLLADSGTAVVDGFNVISNYRDIRKRIGYMPGKFSLYQDLSVEENLNFFATIFGTTLQENYHLIKDIYVQLEPFKKRYAGQLSGGMKQKLALCCALIHKPSVLFLDEPTTGVDAVSRKEFWNMLNQLKSQGLSILVSTPYMDEASLCDRIALIQEGKILIIDTPDEILKKIPGNLLALKSDQMYGLLHDLRDFPNMLSAHIFGETIHFKGENTDILELEIYLKSKNHTNISIKNIVPTIEDVFMELMLLNTSNHGDYNE
jgi:ABC-type multidrug transport system ATPase subunit